MKKAKISLALCFTMLTALFTGCSGGGSEIKIGAVLPLTGTNATFGQSAKNAIELYINDINSKGGVLGKQVKVIYQDDEGKPASAANVARKLISSDKVSAIIGSLTSNDCLAMGKMATQNKVPMITPTGTNAKVTSDGGEYVFRACFLDPFQGTVLAKYSATDLNAKTAAVLYDSSNDYSKGLAENFKESFTNSGGKIVGYASYNTGDTDFNAQLTQLKSSNPDVIMLPDYYNTVGLIAKQARSNGLTGKFVGGDGWESPDLVKVGGDSVNGASFSTGFSADDTAPAVVDFVKAYGAKYNGATPDAFAALSYDSAKIVVEAIKAANSTDGTKVRDAIQKTNLDLVTGKTVYDADRNPIKAADIITMDNGKEKFVKKINP
jgi:branched-chain amino acid transport system substrate-binding protein